MEYVITKKFLAVLTQVTQDMIKMLRKMMAHVS